TSKRRMAVFISFAEMDTRAAQTFWRPARFLAVSGAIREAAVMRYLSAFGVQNIRDFGLRRSGKIRSRTAMAFAALAVAACSSSPGPTYPSVDAFCNAKAQAECQVAAKCAVTMSSCMTARLSACSTTAIQATQSLGRSYVADNADACVDAAQHAFAT